jgi:hypothetical protein
MYSICKQHLYTNLGKLFNFYWLPMNLYSFCIKASNCLIYGTFNCYPNWVFTLNRNMLLFQ